MSQGNFLVYRSSAGSGKTFTLVKEYLKLVLSSEKPDYFRHVLAITFTNKAAEEMRSRAIENLGQLADGNFDEDMASVLFQEIGIPKPLLQSRAKAALRHMLHNFALISISTIDGFVYRLVKSFARELGLSSEFTPSTDQDEFLQKVTDLLLSSAGGAPDLTNLLTRYIESQVEAERSWDVESHLADFAKELMNEAARRPLHELGDVPIRAFFKVQVDLVKKTRSYERDFVGTARDFLAMCKNSGVDDDDFSGKRVLSKVRRQASGDIELFSDNQISQLVEGPWYSKGMDESRKDFVDSVMNEAQPILSRIAALHEDYFDYLFSKKAIRFLSSSALLNQLDQFADELRVEENIIMVSDFHRLINEVIGDNPTPFIYERAGERYRHLLIDEFQDTSMMQWRNFLPLFENALAGGNLCMIVGDAKQAIYRWRNGDVRQFSMLPAVPWNEGIGDVGYIFSQQYNEQFLKQNFRSASAVVEFNNHMFEVIAQGLGPDADLYKDHDQTARKQARGYVCVFPVIRNVTEDLETQVLSYVDQCLEDGFDPSQIAIIVRTKKEGLRIASSLIESNHQVVTEDSLRVGTSPWARLVAATMLLPGHAAEVEILKSLNEIEGLPFEKMVHESGMLAAKDTILPFLENRFEKRLKLGDELNLFARLQRCLEFYSIQNTDVFLDGLSNEVYRMSKSGATLTQFGDWWNERGKEKVLPVHSDNGIQIITIHKSKGLQFPAVIYPIQSGGRNDTRLWVNTRDKLEIPWTLVPYDKKLAESHGAEFEEELRMSQVDAANLHYVAMTRAEHRLYCVFESGKTPPKPDSSRYWFEEALKAIFGSRVTSEVSTGTREEKPPIKEKVESSVHENGRTGAMPTAIAVVTSLSPDFADAFSASEKGTLLHEVLERAEAQSVEQILEDMSFDGQIDLELKKEFGSMLPQILEHPAMKRWMDTESMAEVDIIDENGRIFRPDKIARFEDHLEVVDYKSGKPEDKHHVQVRKYVKLLEQVQPKPVSGHLFYTSSLRHVIVEP